MESARTAGVGLVALVVLTAAAAGIAAAAGTTDVMLSPENETVEQGTNVTYEVVVAEAAGGVGSFEATVSTNDSSVASVRSVGYAGDPAHANEQTGTDEVNLSATGMDTLDDGPVDIATVTVRAERDGVAGLSLSVAALGDERGRSYDVAETRGRTLTVGSDQTPTPTDGSGSDDGDGSDEDGDDSDSTESSTATPTATPTPNATVTSTATPTPTDAPTATPTDTPTPTPTATAANETSTGGAAPSPSETATPSESESGVPPLAVAAGLVALLAVAGAAYWTLQN